MTTDRTENAPDAAIKTADAHRRAGLKVQPESNKSKTTVPNLDDFKNRDLGREGDPNDGDDGRGSGPGPQHAAKGHVDATVERSPGHGSVRLALCTMPWFDTYLKGNGPMPEGPWTEDAVAVHVGH